MLFIILRRLLQAVLVLLLVALVAFTIFRYIGDPVESLLGQEATVADQRALIERLGLDDPIPVQYLRFVGNALQGNFGISYRTAEPVSGLIAERLPATLELALVSALFAMTLGTLLGIYTAIYRDGFVAHAIMSSSLIGVSLPTSSAAARPCKSVSGAPAS
jgi:peptide/nickel transport system permease protein